MDETLRLSREPPLKTSPHAAHGVRRWFVGVLLSLLCCGCLAPVESVKLIAAGDVRELRERPDGEPANDPTKPGILLIALDGVDRELLYPMLRAGDLPALEALLGGRRGQRFPHAYFDDAYLSTLPSSTIAAWVTALTGVGPAVHGVTGNEFFIREQRTMAAPVPVTFDDTSPVLACYTSDYLDGNVRATSVYERLRETDPDIRIWVAMQQFHRGADELLLTDRGVIVDAFEAFVEEQVDKKLDDRASRAVYEKLDAEVIDAVADNLGDGPLPDVLTVYLPGTDSFAHVSEMGPDEARRQYLMEVVDPLLGELSRDLADHGALSDRYVVVTADHGHTEVLKDQTHALATDGPDDPPAVLRSAGFRLRPFRLEVKEDDDFNAVLAYQGAMAFVYVADRSTCPAAGSRCDWSRPPRFREDVLAVADAFYTNNRTGETVPGMKGTLDLVLARRPRSFEADDLPFEVYIGKGRLEPVTQYLRRHPHPDYVAIDERLRDLAVGPYGERAGDVVLLAHNGDRADPKQRYYFAAPYHSWHGSPSRRDSDIPLIVAHAGESTSQIRSLVHRAFGGRPAQQKLTDVLLALRQSEPRPKVAGITQSHAASSHASHPAP